MGRLYKVSADVSEKEKAVGGIMTIGQAVWLAAGFLSGGAVFLLLAQIVPPVIGLLIGLAPGIALGAMFAFHKKQGLPYMQYLLLNKRFKKKTKQMINSLAYGKSFPEDSE